MRLASSASGFRSGVLCLAPFNVVTLYVFARRRKKAPGKRHTRARTQNKYIVGISRHLNFPLHTIVGTCLSRVFVVRIPLPLLGLSLMCSSIVYADANIYRKCLGGSDGTANIVVSLDTESKKTVLCCEAASGNTSAKRIYRILNQKTFEFVFLFCFVSIFFFLFVLCFSKGKSDLRCGTW